MKIRAKLVASCIAALTAVGIAAAVVPSARWAEATDARLHEINKSLAQIQTDLGAADLEESQRKQLGELAQSFEAEKKVLLERRELLRRLENAGLLIYLSPPTPAPKQP
jgi:Spy/CpxP family protein refolding chaperone